ncbi:MAG: VIT family protein [Euryarchaeota archaeon ADurb.BinA087]|nr:MAG: VIT family protein [Euryarchaeota archaeon ADurb.BinA087]HPX73871.1 VIT1/CCC1 transporter family protein [Methanoregulaceae archaeon]
MLSAEGASRALAPELLERIEVFQKGEITEYKIYQNLAARIPDLHNRQVLEKMAREELGHYSFWKRLSGRDVQPDRLKLVFYLLVTRLFGLTFGVKLMEKRESEAVQTYREILETIPEAARILEDEEEHEHQIVGMLDEKQLRYVGSVVLGINDALVEFTGSLAGFTLALQNTQLIAAAGLIMGIAASLSMGASEYLSQKSERSDNPLTAALYTGGAYVLTVGVLIMPFLLMGQPLQAFALTLTLGILIIVLFTFYTSVAKDLPFLKRFAEMATISLGIAAISFVIGILVRVYLNVEV